MSNRTVTMMGIFALAAMPALAQTSPTGSGPGGSGSSTDQSSSSRDKTRSSHGSQGTTDQGATSGSSSMTSGASKLSSADKRFVSEAAQGGLAEVELGRLATQKAQSADVKSFGQQMVDDHTKANDELKSLASGMGVTVPSDLDSADKAEMARLEKLSGDQFDKAYMQRMVKDHRKDIAEFKRESSSGRDAQVKEFASKTLPTLEQHLQHAEHTASAVGVSTSGSSHSMGTSGASSHSQKKGSTNSGGK